MLGKQELELPKRNVLDGVPFWLELIPGLDDGLGSALLRLTAEEVAREVPGYRERDGQYEAHVVLRVEVLDEKDKNWYVSSDSQFYRDAWFGRGRLKESVTEWDEETGFYKVYSARWPTLSWTAMRMQPDPARPIPEDPFEFWVATCRDKSSPITSTGRVTSCSSRLVHEDLLLNFHIKGFNLHLIDEVKAMLLRKLQEWKQDE